MNTKVLIAGAVTVFTMAISSCTFAATGTVDFKASTNQVKKGDTFTVTLSAQTEDGINGVDTKYTYNSEKLELVSSTLSDSTKWTNLGSGQDITVISNSEQSVKNANLYVLKFKVKDNASVGDILKVETNEILLDTDAQENSEVSIGAKKVEVTVIESSSEEPKQEEPGTKTDEPEKQEESGTKTDEPEKQEEPGTKTDEPTKSEEIKKESDDSTTKSGEVKEAQTKTITTEDNKVEENVATKKLPKTGVNHIVFIVATLLVLVGGIVFFKKDKSLDI